MCVKFLRLTEEIGGGTPPATRPVLINPQNIILVRPRGGDETAKAQFVTTSTLNQFDQINVSATFAEVREML